MHSTKYIYTFVLTMTTVVALLLTGLYTLWKDQSKQNEAVFNKREILKSAKDYLGDGIDIETISDEEVLTLFDGNVEQFAFDVEGNKVEEAGIVAAGYSGGKPEFIEMRKEKKKAYEDRIAPLYVFNSEGGKLYIMSVVGSGLWDDIWGNIAIKNDLTTVAGASFDHAAETPGLGAEIKDNPAFAANLKGEKIFNDEGKYTPIRVVKGGAPPSDLHAIDGISGATVTAVGVGKMLDTGIGFFLPYITKQKGAKTKTTGMR